MNCLRTSGGAFRNADLRCLFQASITLSNGAHVRESVLLALDDELSPTTAMAEAPHGTAPSLEGKNVANPMAMLLACAAVLDHAGIQGDDRATEAAHELRNATLSTAMDGVRTFDLNGTASTSEVVDEVVTRMRNR